MTLSLKQRAEEIAKTYFMALYPRWEAATKDIEQALQEVREESIREAANIADDFSPDPEYGREIAKRILELLPPPKTGKP